MSARELKVTSGVLLIVATIRVQVMDVAMGSVGCASAICFPVVLLGFVSVRGPRRGPQADVPLGQQGTGAKMLDRCPEAIDGTGLVWFG